MKKIKVALVHNIISPYRIPVFNHLASKRNLDLTVYFLNESARNRKWETDFYRKKINFNYEILPSINLKIPFVNSIEYNINPTIFFKLYKNKFDAVVISGWVDFVSQTLPFLTSFYSFKYILWAGSTKDEPSIQRWLFLPLVKSIIRRASSIIPYGTKSKRYLMNLDANKDIIVNSFNAIDVDYFQNKIKKITKSKINILKTSYNISKNTLVILYVGQFIPRKSLSVLIKAASMLNKDLSLVFLGHGDEKDNYISLANELSVKLTIINHLERDKLPEIYKMSDLFILPSREEVWGLVVNEAMACGLPVICSDNVGCVEDLVINEVNGFVFKSDDPKSLAEMITLISKDKSHLKKMGNESKKIIKTITTEKSANSINLAIKKALS